MILVPVIVILMGICLYNLLVLKRKPTPFLVICISVISLLFLATMLFPSR